MGTDPTSRTILTLLGVAFVVWCLYLVRDVLPPFILALALATVMEPVSHRFELAGMRRGLAIALTFVSFLAIFIGGVVILLPLAMAEAAQLVSHIPDYYQGAMDGMSSLSQQHTALLRKYNVPNDTAARLFTEYKVQVGHYLQDLLASLGGTLRYVAGRLIWIVIVPIVALYMVIDFDRIRARAYHMVPDAHRDRTMQIVASVMRVFINYLRGLFLLCVAYGLTLGVALGLLFQLPYALVVAIAGGILYAVPYIGPVATIAISAMIAWADSDGTLGRTLGVAGAALFINEVFDFVITPKVLSRQTGLHPILNIFALMAGGTLFGFVGLILAVPAAASIKEVLRHFFPRLTEDLSQGEARERRRHLWWWVKPQL